MLLFSGSKIQTLSIIFYAKNPFRDKGEKNILCESTNPVNHIYPKIFKAKEEKMSKKWFLKLFAVLAVLSFALAACGGGATEAPATTAPATVAPATAAPATAAPATVAPAKKQAMKAMFLGTTQDVAILGIIKQVTDQFNANNPYNVEFSYETYGND
jgi:hypothetical protein